MFSIRPNGTTYDLLLDGAVVRTGLTREQAVAQLGNLALALAPADADGNGIPDGALPRRWAGVLIDAAPTTSDDRDLTNATLTWRDPPLPLMFQSTTDVGHDGAELAGWIDTVEQVGTELHGAGWLYDNPAGRGLAQVFDAQGTFGVSADGGMMEGEWVCDEMGDDGWCQSERLVVSLLEVIGATATPFPAFAQAAIGWEDGGAPPESDAPATEPAPAVADVPEPMPAAAAVPELVLASAPVLPPAAWYTEPEPAAGDPRLVRQPDGQYGVPLTITDDGQVFGHAALWGTCHTGLRGRCVTPPRSPSSYAHFHVGAVQTAEGDTLATGCLVAGADHASLHLLAPEARAHYDHTAAAWADVRATDGQHGVWIAGAVRPHVLDQPELLRVLRASAPSGDWRTIGGRLDLLAIQQVNVPGFPVVREALAASGVQLAPSSGPQVAERMGVVVALVAPNVVLPEADQVEALVASGTLERCPSCGQRSGAQHARIRRMNSQPAGNMAAVMEVLTDLARTVHVLDVRTRHLNGPARDALARRLGRAG